MQENRNYHGVTLIELMVVIGIIVIMSLVAWTTLGSSKKNVDVDSACSQMLSSINKARSYALSGKSDSSKLIKISGATGANSYVMMGLTTANETSILPKGITTSSFTCAFSLPSGAQTNPSCGLIT